MFEIRIEETAEGNVYHVKVNNMEIKIGSTYEVRPGNKQKNLKNRGRLCTVLSFREWPSSCGKHQTLRARVEWRDTGQYGYVDPRDLAPVQHEKGKVLNEISALLRKLPAEKVARIREILEATKSKPEALKKIDEVLAN